MLQVTKGLGTALAIGIFFKATGKVAFSAPAGARKSIGAVDYSENMIYNYLHQLQGKRVKPTKCMVQIRMNGRTLDCCCCLVVDQRGRGRQLALAWDTDTKGHGLAEPVNCLHQSMHQLLIWPQL
jgi:hypothetical protein